MVARIMIVTIVLALILILVVTSFAAGITNITRDFFNPPSQEANDPSDIGLSGGIDFSYFWDLDRTGYLYPDDELNPPLTKSEILDYFKIHLPISDCEGCTSCTEDTGTGDYECNRCDTCEEESGNFRDCILCYECEEDNCPSDYSCSLCEDYDEDENLCAAVKNCIEDYYVNQEPCIIDIIPYKNSLSGILDDIENIITDPDCVGDVEMIVDYRTDTKQTVCTFDPSLEKEKVLYEEIKMYTDGCEKYPGRGECRPMQFFNFEKKVPVNGIYAKWTPGTELGDTWSFMLCKDHCKKLQDIRSDSSGNPGKIKDEWLCINNDRNGCVIAYEKCNDCRNEKQSFFVHYNGIVEKIAGRTCKGTTECYNDHSENAPDTIYTIISEALDYFEVTIYPHVEYLASTTYQKCDMHNILIKPNTIYYNSEDLTSSTLGNLKLSLTNLDTETEKDCRFNLFVCSSDTFAETIYDDIYLIFDYITDFETTLNYKIYTNTKTTGTGAKPTITHNGEIIRYNSVDFILDKDYTSDEIIKTVKEAIRFWKISRFSETTHQKINQWKSNGATIPELTWSGSHISNYAPSFNNNCWEASFDDIMTNVNTAFDHEKLYYDCGADDICSGTLRLNLAWVYRKDTNHVFPFVSFCTN